MKVGWDKIKQRPLKSWIQDPGKSMGFGKCKTLAVSRHLQPCGSSYVIDVFTVQQMWSLRISYSTGGAGRVSSCVSMPRWNGSKQLSADYCIFSQMRGIIYYSPVLKVNRLNLAFDYMEFCFMAKCVLLISQLRMSALMSSKNLDLKTSPFFSHQNFLI